MGKTSKKSSSTSSSNKEAPPKCSCTDPFTCACGHRPPRPSRGHKWHADTQEWAGKGHKQKGASGQVASVAASAVTTKVGQTTIESWQRLPSALLDDYSKKQKKPPARYESIGAGVGVGKADKNSSCRYRYRVILPDLKNPDKDLRFAPAHAVGNPEQAKEEAALLALLTLTSTLPHERKLPEPYKQTWLYAKEQARKMQNNGDDNDDKKKSTATSDPPAATTRDNSRTPSSSSSSAAAKPSTRLTSSTPSFASQAERRAHEQQVRQRRNARIRHHEAVRLANAPHRVHMSVSIRRRIEALLRGDAVSWSDDDDGDDAVDSDDDIECNNAVAGDAAIRDLRAYVIQRLVGEGFTRKQARKAFQEELNSRNAAVASKEDEWDNVYESSLQWLLVHLNEDQLPEGFDPQSGMLDVIAAAPKIKTNDDGLARLYSLTAEDAAFVASKAATASPKPVESMLWELFLAASGVTLEITSTEFDSATNMELLESELDAIQSIYDSACAVSKGASETIISIRIPETGLALEIVVENGVYPSAWPSRVFVSGTWEFSRPVGVAMHVEILRFMAESLALGEFMMLEILSQVQQLLLTCDDLAIMTLKPGMKMKKADDSSSSTVEAGVASRQPSNVHIASTASNNQRRPRERSKFWSVPPRKTPPAVAFPKISKLLEAARESLPAAAARAEFYEKLEACSSTGNVMLVTGATGCGKTTQICQFILELIPQDAKIVVAQPRRLAATGVAARVAEERGEQRPGMDSVGYVVRGDSAISDRTRLLFCTTGVLLRQMQNASALDCVSHILIDECHERSLDSDILLGLLKQIKSSYPSLKIILMSATIDSERMAAYWGARTPTMDIPGRTFPVTDYSLEDVFALTHTVDPAAIEELCKHAKILDYDLMGRLVKALIARRDKTDDGSILIFLPGAPEISKASEAIKRRTEGMSLLLLPLHGGLQPKDQSRIFRPAPFGSTKVILSTNIAETSVTIPDCTVVIDSCREKQSSYDPANRMPLLVEQFASRASLKQRRGRAGRVRAGVCYKLVSKQTLAILAEHSEPEIRRCALDQTLISLLYLGVEDGSGNFMCTLLDPPSTDSLQAATESLKMLGAIENGSAPKTLIMTPMGQHLAGIPAPPLIGKLLVLGSILGCRSAAIGMAAGLSLSRSPFLHLDDPRPSRRQQHDQEESIEEVKSRRTLKNRRELADKVGNSDHALLASLFVEWKSNRGEGGRKTMCETFGLSFPAMKEIEQLGNLLDSALSSIGFPASAEADSNMISPRIIHTCAVSAMSPGQLVKVVRPKATYNETAQGAKEKDNISKDLKLFIRVPSASSASACGFDEKEERVFVHPASSNFLTGTYSCPWLVYFQLLRTSKPYLRDVTECSPYALLLFGGPLTVQASKGLIMVDNWVSLSANARIGSLVGGLRRQVDQLLALKTADASIDISNTDTMKLITTILKTDGTGGSS